MRDSFLITREEHLNHLVRVVPIVGAVLLSQYWLLSNLNPTAPVFELSVFLALAVVMFVFILIHYDTYHQVRIYEAHFTINYPLLGPEQIFRLADIQQIDIHSEDSNFSNLTLYMKDRPPIKILFVDSPSEVRALLLKNKINFPMAA